MFQFVAPSLDAIGLHVLYDLKPYDEPFAYVRADRVDPALLSDLRRRSQQALDWVRYDSFYRCWIASVDGAIEPSESLVRIMRQLVDIPLAPTVRCTIQRMAAGDGATVHSDRPLLGYEAARLIIQLTPDWQPHMGGRFAVHPDAEGTCTSRRHDPRPGTAVAFAMRPHAHHSVEQCAAERLTAVLHFEHIGNTRQLADALRSELGPMNFSELPPNLAAAMNEAEARLPETDTLRAATVAWLLQRWGCPTDTLHEAYSEGLGPWTAGGPFPAARWVARLWTEDFSIDDWPLARAAAATDPTVPTHLADLLFPSP